MRQRPEPRSIVTRLVANTKLPDALQSSLNAAADSYRYCALTPALGWLGLGSVVHATTVLKAKMALIEAVRQQARLACFRGDR